MPFEVFRRHQRKLLAIFAILAMFGFVVSDSLPKLLSASTAAATSRSSTLYGKTVYRSDLNEMAEQRSSANQFVAQLIPLRRPDSVRRPEDPGPGRRPDPPARGRPARASRPAPRWAGSGSSRSPATG